jgi:hypothetical protein
MAQGRTGGEEGMKFDLRKPCNNCPFRTDIVFTLAQARVEQIVHAITELDQTFACHKHLKNDDDGFNIPHKNDQHCAGAMILLERIHRPNQMMRIAERVGLYDRHKLDMSAPVFGSADEMIGCTNWTPAHVQRRLALPQPKPWPPRGRFGVARAINNGD